MVWRPLDSSSPKGIGENTNASRVWKGEMALIAFAE